VAGEGGDGTGLVAPDGVAPLVSWPHAGHRDNHPAIRMHMPARTKAMHCRRKIIVELESGFGVPWRAPGGKRVQLAHRRLSGNPLLGL